MSGPSRDPALGPVTDDRPAKLPTRTVLRGRVVDLVPLDPDAHGDSLFGLTGGRENSGIWTYLRSGPFVSRREFEGYLHQLAGSDDPLCYAIVDRSSSRATGWVCYMRIDPPNRVIEVGNVVFSRDLRRTMGATEAIYLMARTAFEKLGYRRFEWKCNALNAASRRAALRFGFTFEGVFRQHMIVKGRSRDSAWFSMLDTEWPERRAAFEAWLRPSNFDKDGHQKTALSALNGVSP
jgi:RimJ/RimL family protein N-acetyltransferase